MLCAVCVRHFQAGRDLDPRAGARVVLEQPSGSRSYLSNGSSSSHTRRRGALVLSSSTAALNCSPKPDARQARKASSWISPYGRVPVRVVLASSFWARQKNSRPGHLGHTCGRAIQLDAGRTGRRTRERGGAECNLIEKKVIVALLVLQETASQAAAAGMWGWRWGLGAWRRGVISHTLFSPKAYH